MTTHFYDDFNRADGAPGSNWLDPTNWEILSNKLRMKSISGGNIINRFATRDGMNWDLQVEAYTLAPHGGVILAADKDNFIYLDIGNDGTTWLKLNTYIGGVETSPASRSMVAVYVAGAPIRMVRYGTMFYCYYNNVFMFSQSIDVAQFNVSTLYAGVFGTSAGMLLDNFYAEASTRIFYFKYAYKKSGVRTAPSASPTMKIFNLERDRVTSGMNPSWNSNAPGVYHYTHYAAQDSKLIGLLSTTDLTMDAPDLESIPDTYYEVDARSDELAASLADKLDAADYTAPDNAGIAAVQAKTDNLPTDPADQSLVEAAILAAVAGLATATSLSAAQAILDRVNTMLEGSGLNWRFTSDALAHIPPAVATISMATVDASNLQQGIMTARTHHLFSQGVQSDSLVDLSTHQFGFAIKETPTQSDADALVYIDDTGLVTLNKAAASDPTQGVITVSGAAGAWTISMRLDAAATASLAAAYTRVYEVKDLTSGEMIAEGTAYVVSGIIKA